MKENIHRKRQIVDPAEHEKFIRKFGNDRDRHLRDEKVENGANAALLYALVLVLVCFLQKIACELIEFSRVLKDPPCSAALRFQNLADDTEVDALVLDLGRDPPLQRVRHRSTNVSDNSGKLPDDFLQIHVLVPGGHVEKPERVGKALIVGSQESSPARAVELRVYLFFRIAICARATLQASVERLRALVIDRVLHGRDMRIDLGGGEADEASPHRAVRSPTTGELEILENDVVDLARDLLGRELFRNILSVHQFL